MTLPIAAFVGPNGDGKTLLAMELVVKPALLSGRRVVSTCEIFHPNASLLESWLDIPSLKDCVLFLDEISTILPARNAMSAPSSLVSLVKQMRKSDIELVWTAPDWSDADKALRRVTQSVTVCRGYLSDKYVRTREIPPWWNVFGTKLLGVDGRPVMHEGRWGAKTVFRAKTFSAKGFEEFSFHAVKDVRPIERFWYVAPWHDTRWMYDTLQPVNLLDAVDDVGSCVVCGGYKKRRACVCRPTVRRARVAVPTLAPPVADEDGVEL